MAKSNHQHEAVAENWQECQSRLTAAGKHACDDEALDQYRYGMSRRDQIALIEQIIATRGWLYEQSFLTVIGLAMVMAPENKGPNPDGSSREPHLGFMVERKWQRAKRHSVRQHLPKLVLGHWPIDGLMTCVAVPTEVIDARDEDEVTLKSDYQKVTVNPEHQVYAVGAITCALERGPLHGDNVYFLSCKHVFSLTERYYPRQPVGLSVQQSQTTRKVGETLAVSGILESDSDFGFDAQLGLATDPELLAQNLSAAHVTEFVRGPQWIPNRVLVLQPEGPVEYEYIITRYKRPIDYGNAGYVAHELLLRLERRGGWQIEDGDSGAAVVTMNQKTFIGMMIAANSTLAFAIPAWQLLSPAYYQGAANAEQWRLLAASIEAAD